MSQDPIDILAARRSLDRLSREVGSTHEAAAVTKQRAADAARVGATAAALGPSPAQATTWLRAAAEAGDTEAMVHLGGRLVDDPDTFSEAEPWLRKAADAGNNAGRYHLARFLLFTNRADEADTWFSAAFAEEPELAMSLIAELRQRGAVELAQEWLDKAATRGWLARSAPDGDAVAAATHGLRLVAEGRLDEARPVLEQAAAAGIDAVRPALAAVYISENRVEDAFRSLERAAAAGDAESPYAFASVMLERGDRPGAIRALEIAAEAGNAQAILRLGRTMLADRRFPEAVRWLSLDAVADLPDRGLLLGMAQSEIGETEAAKETFKAAARSGDARAAHKLALLYEQENDVERAMAWYERAADQGEVSSIYNLGLLLADRDPAGASVWLKRASDAGHAQAPYALALNAFQAGRHDEGAAWLQLGASRGDERATRALAELSKVGRGGRDRRRWRRTGG